jgi:excinuclease UvrABC nuclease subunit
MGTKKVKFTEEGISKLPNNKPVLYRIETNQGGLNYVGTAKRGRVQERLEEHLGEIPGVSVRVEQFSTVAEAEKKEKNVIERAKPKYNQQGK